MLKTAASMGPFCSRHRGVLSVEATTEENVQREIPVEPEMQMMPEIPEMEEFDIRAHEKKKRKERKKRIKKNPRKNWKELGLLEKRGLA